MRPILKPQSPLVVVPITAPRKPRHRVIERERQRRREAIETVSPDVRRRNALRFIERAYGQIIEPERTTSK